MHEQSCECNKQSVQHVSSLLHCCHHSVMRSSIHLPNVLMHASCSLLRPFLHVSLTSFAHPFIHSLFLCFVLFMQSHTPLESPEATSTVVDSVVYDAASTRQGTCPYLQLCMQTPGSRHKMPTISASCMIQASSLCTSLNWLHTPDCKTQHENGIWRLYKGSAYAGTIRSWSRIQWSCRRSSASCSAKPTAWP